MLTFQTVMNQNDLWETEWRVILQMLVFVFSTLKVHIFFLHVHFKRQYSTENCIQCPMMNYTGKECLKKKNKKIN